jgi:hypothetical protein
MENTLITPGQIASKIYLIRGRKVMLDRDLADLYGVPTMVLNQSVKRNIGRFPEDFMFQLTPSEAKNLISQFVISSGGYGGHRKLPLAFTEQGVAMLSSVLRSERAVMVNIQIIRTFTRLRELIAENADLRQKMEELEKRYDGQFEAVFEAIRQLLIVPETKNEEIGFRIEI